MFLLSAFCFMLFAVEKGDLCAQVASQLSLVKPQRLYTNADAFSVRSEIVPPLHNRSTIAVEAF